MLAESNLLRMTELVLSQSLGERRQLVLTSTSTPQDDQHQQHHRQYRANDPECFEIHGSLSPVGSIASTRKSENPARGPELACSGVLVKYSLRHADVPARLIHLSFRATGIGMMVAGHPWASAKMRLLRRSLLRLIRDRSTD